MSRTTYIPDGFSIVEVDADGNEIDPEKVAEDWDTVLGSTQDEILLEKVKLFTFFDPDIKEYYVVSKRELSLLQIQDVEEPSGHDWIGSESYRTKPANVTIDYATNPWASHNRNYSEYRYEFREPIADPADRAGAAFMGNIAERVAYLAGQACNLCNIVRASNGNCYC
jgi:hypothetical protein